MRMRTINAFAFGCTEISGKLKKTGQIDNMQPSTNVEMQLLLCKHCLKHHVNKQQNDSIKISQQKECNDSMINKKLVPSTSTRKKQTKNNGIINNPFNVIDNNGIDQQHTITTINDGAYALNSFGALQSTLSFRNNQITDNSSNQLHCHENNRQKTSMNQQINHINPMLISRYYVNNQEEQLMIEYDENAEAIERLTSNQFKTNPNDNVNDNYNYDYFNEGIMSQKSSFYTFCTNQSDKCLSGENDNSKSNDNNNRPKSHVHTKPAHLSRRTLSTLSSPSSATMNYSHVFLLCLSFCVIGMRSALVLADETPANSENSLITSTETGICSSRDIRNSVSMFNELKGCRVIEGFLMLTLIEKYNETDYDNLTFPELTEITEFFILYRVNGLKTLANLFPNLRIIRGNSLIADYSFIIYEMMHLQEIGLKSLTQIARGSVRIEKNPALCFVDTIDWSLITLNAIAKENIFKLNKPQNECPKCPNNDNGNGNDASKNSTECPLSTESKERLCWNRKFCQKMCPSHCGNKTCNEKGQCCDEQCLGCQQNNITECLTCRFFSVGQYPKRQCVQKCPSGLFAIQNHRCVTAEDCRKFPQPINVKFDYALSEYPYIPIDGDCTITCPYNHYPDGPSGQRVCRKCAGSTCRKECPPGIIDSKAKAQQYKGCTHITGELRISIKNQGGNIVRELDVFLSDIEEIQGPLTIVRSYPLISLSFFKNLKRIQGQRDSIGLKVVENQNLQALFPENSTVIVEHGRLFFHFNPKLCMNIINEFKKNVVDLRNVSSLSPDDVAPNSNGDKIACIVTELNVTIVSIKPYFVLMHVIPMVYEDERQLLGYLVYYMPAPNQNVTMFDGRDACGSDGWSVDEVAGARNVSFVPIVLTHLKPYTQYAYYVRTYTVASEQRGGMTKIKYFTTAPDKPEQVTRVSASINGNSSSEILVKWGPPVRAHGNLTHYVIKCSIVEEDEKLLEQRNYCNEPLGDAKITAITTKPVDVKPPMSTTSDEKCSCDENARDGKGSIFEKDAEQLIEFEDELHNTVYVWQEPQGRQRRDIPTHAFKTSEMLRGISRHKRSNNNSTITNGMSNIDVFPNINNNAAGGTKNMQGKDDTELKMDPSGRYYRYFYVVVNASVNSYLLTKLKHYTYYGISVKACREGGGDNCGTEVFVHQRTGKIEEADDVTDVSVERLPSSNHSIGVLLTWKPPENPNGIVVSYVVRYQRVDVDHTQYHDSCIAHNAFRKQRNTHIITEHLSNGNFSFIVGANSLAGPNTRWSKPIYKYIKETSLTPGWIISILFLIVILIGFVGAVIWFYRRKYGPPTSGLKIIASVNPEYVSMQYTPDEWEIPREKIIQLTELGQGSFGMVYEGILMQSDQENDRIRCAIKSVNENATDRERINFLKEASVMKAFDTHHVVHLLGVVSRGQPVLVVMELMALGDLKGYLRSHRPESGNDIIQPPSLHRILQMAIEIADGMAYLSAKKFVHRDLAARNCMVAEDLTVKIGDFGMTRDIYETDYYRKGTKGLLPVRWMAPESLKDGVFSSSSDVFSFGIVLWEMSTLASQPYQGLSNDQVLRYVIDGGVMERPENCPEKLYNLMCKTWQHRPSSRPTFIQMISMLLDEAEPHFQEVSFYHSTAGQELLQLPQHQVMEVVDVRTPLRAEEENFSVGVEDEEDDPEDPNSFLMEKRSIHQAASTSGPVHSPLRTANKSQIPDVALSKPIPKIYSHHLQMSLNPRTSRPVNPEASSSSSATPIKPSSLFTMPNNVTNVFGRNGIKPNYTALAQQKYASNIESELNATVADNLTTSYCNHIV